MRKIMLYWTVCLIVVCAGGCKSKEIILYCGAGIRKPTEQIAHAFEDETGVKVDCRFGGSGQMFQKLAKSKEADLYMAGAYYVDKAKKQHLVIAQQTVCYVRPVILVRKGNPKIILTLHDLARPDIKIHFVDPSKCQSGIVSERILAKNKVDMKSIRANLVRPLPEGKKSIDLIKNGLLDAAIVWDAQASAWMDKIDIVSIPEEQNQTWPVCIALLEFSNHQNHAKRFMDFLTSKKGETIFMKHHFQVNRLK